MQHTQTRPLANTAPFLFTSAGLAVVPLIARAELRLEEVVVTATKRTQNLQKTPAAITALTGSMLASAGVTDIRSAQAFAPSVRFQQENASTEIYIRGVGSTLDVPQIEPPTSFNFEGVYVPREATSVPLYDIEQLEVLPGPQGTLYGRSTLGGAVNVSFRRPTRQYETSTTLETGNHAMFHMSAAQNLPVTDALAIRIAADYHEHDGYMASGADSLEDLGLRLSALYSRSERFSAYVWGSTVEKDGHPPNLVPKGVDPATAGLSPDRYLNADPWSDRFPEPYASALPFGQPRAEAQRYDNDMAGAQLDFHPTQNLTLTYIPSYLEMSVAADYWLGAFPGNKTDAYRQTTHELRAGGNAGWGEWLVGLYAYELNSDGVFLFAGFELATALPVSIVDANRIEGWALFGQATRTMGEKWRLILGGRFSDDERTGHGRYAFDGGLAPYAFAQDYDRVDYKIGVEYDVAADVMFYGMAQTAYQPGTFNTYAGTPAISNAVDEARLLAYAAGLKSRLLDDRLQVNTELFFYDYDGLFASAYNTVINSAQTFNAQKVEIYGSQLDVLLQPSATARLSMSIGYLHARNVHFALPDGTATFDGLQLQYAPDWTARLGYAHDLFAGSGHVRVAASTRYEDRFFADFSHTPGGRQSAHFKSDASLTYFSPHGWSIGAWIRNIENEAVIAATAGGSNLPALSTGATAFLETPRTYGLRITVDLGD